jgi:amidophosphoribosyltransferase
MPTTAERELAVRMKLHPVRESISGKRIIMVDDSLVRGTTARILVQLLKEGGAKEVHLRLSAPEILWPCFFGIDIPTREELISNYYSPDEIAELTGADSVQFLSVERLHECLDAPNRHCFACFTGNYPMQVPLSEEERRFEARSREVTADGS